MVERPQKTTTMRTAKKEVVVEVEEEVALGTGEAERACHPLLLPIRDHSLHSYSIRACEEKMDERTTAMGEEEEVAVESERNGQRGTRNHTVEGMLLVLRTVLA